MSRKLGEKEEERIFGVSFQSVTAAKSEANTNTFTAGREKNSMGFRVFNSYQTPTIEGG
jgi:hypothetical protein